MLSRVAVKKTFRELPIKVNVKVLHVAQGTRSIMRALSWQWRKETIEPPFQSGVFCGSNTYFRCRKCWSVLKSESASFICIQMCLESPK